MAVYNRLDFHTLFRQNAWIVVHLIFKIRGLVFLSLMLILMIGCEAKRESENSENTPKNPAPKGSNSVTNNPSASEKLPPEVVNQTAPPQATQKFQSVGEIHALIKKSNPQYSGNAQFGLNEKGEVIHAEFPQAGISNIDFLKSWPLQSLDLMANPVSDISALSGKNSLQVLYIERTNVSDLGPLYGLPIKQLYISNSPVKDLTPLIDMPLVEFNAVGTGISNLLPLARSPIQMIWLSETLVSDISPLIACPIVSLTLHRTPVENLTPLVGTNIRRLHIAESNVTDLTPIQSLRLERLIFSPERIQIGLDAVKNMPFLREIGTTFDTRTSPAQFWQMFEATKK